MPMITSVLRQMWRTLLSKGAGRAACPGELSAFGKSAEDGIRVRAEDRGWCWSLWRAGRGQWGACGQDPADPWLVDEADQGVGERLWGRGELRERAIPLPQDGGARQCLGDLGGCVLGEPGGNEGGDHLAVGVAVAVLGEVGAEGPLDGGEGLGSPADPREVRVVPLGESHDHDGVTRFRAEVPRETTVQVV